MRYLLFFVFISTAQCRKEYDYYWRDFDGITIPTDAVPADHGLYIGQHFHKGYLVPGTIYPVDGKFVGEYWGKFEAKSDIKILCSRHENKFKWVLVENSTVLPPEEPDCVPVLGGYEYSSVNFRWFIGKAFHEGMWKISKVDFHSIKGLSIWKNDGTYEHLRKFQLLKVCSVTTEEDDHVIYANK